MELAEVVAALSAGASSESALSDDDTPPPGGPSGDPSGLLGLMLTDGAPPGLPETHTDRSSVAFGNPAGSQPQAIDPTGAESEEDTTDSDEDLASESEEAPATTDVEEVLGAELPGDESSGSSASWCLAALILVALLLAAAVWWAHAHPDEEIVPDVVKRVVGERVVEVESMQPAAAAPKTTFE